MRTSIGPLGKLVDLNSLSKKLRREARLEFCSKWDVEPGGQMSVAVMPFAVAFIGLRFERVEGVDYENFKVICVSIDLSNAWSKRMWLTGKSECLFDPILPMDICGYPGVIEIGVERVGGSPGRFGVDLVGLEFVD